MVVLLRICVQPPAVLRSDAQEEEYGAMVSAISELATKHLPPSGGRRRGWHFTLSQRTLWLMDGPEMRALGAAQEQVYCS
jgi:hypothetical protein